MGMTLKISLRLGCPVINKREKSQIVNLRSIFLPFSTLLVIESLPFTRFLLPFNESIMTILRADSPFISFDKLYFLRIIRNYYVSRQNQQQQFTWNFVISSLTISIQQASLLSLSPVSPLGQYYIYGSCLQKGKCVVLTHSHKNQVN